MTKQFFYKAMGETFGPLTGAQVKELVRAGEVTPDTHLRAGNGEWFLAGSSKTLFPALAESKPSASISELDDGFYTLINDFADIVPDRKEELNVTCPHCNRILDCSGQAGRTVRCPICSGALAIPEAVPAVGFPSVDKGFDNRTHLRAGNGEWFLAGSSKTLFPATEDRQEELNATCPHCNHTIGTSAVEGETIRCPSCNGNFANPEIEWQCEASVPCPYCRETIRGDAKKCKHCGEFLDENLARQRTTGANYTPSSKSQPQQHRPLVSPIAAVLFIVFGVGLVIVGGSSYDNTNRVQREWESLRRNKALAEYTMNNSDDFDEQRRAANDAAKATMELAEFGLNPPPSVGQPINYIVAVLGIVCVLIGIVLRVIKR